jgi:hypothetical protein
MAGRFAFKIRYFPLIVLSAGQYRGEVRREEKDVVVVEDEEARNCAGIEDIRRRTIHRPPTCTLTGSRPRGYIAAGWRGTETKRQLIP